MRHEGQCVAEMIVALPPGALTTLLEIANVYLGSTAAPPLEAIVAERAAEPNLQLGRAHAAQHWAAA